MRNNEMVMQYNSQAQSPEEAQEIADALQVLDGCIDARTFGTVASAHFEIDQDNLEAPLPDGCRLVPRAVVDFYHRRDQARTTK